MTEGREYSLSPIICLTCGFDGEKPVPARDGVPVADTCRCPRCSKRAYVQNPLRSRFVIAALAKEVAKLRLDIMDLQGAYDDY